MKDLGLLALRVTFGSLIALHGYPKLFGGPDKKVSPEVERYLGPGFSQFMANGGLDKHIGFTRQLGMPAPEALGTLSAGTEFFGGLALLLGNMAVAIKKVHAKNGLMNQGGYEVPLMFAAVFLTTFLSGSGKIGLDRG